MDSLRSKEAKNINTDLLELGLGGKQSHLPFKNSVLNKVLKECLQAQCFSAMIVCKPVQF
jgi:hypothetical protein